MKSVEEVFALGLNVTKIGRLNATVYWKEDAVIILNSDNTLLVKFEELRPSRKDEVSFYVKDYEGMNIQTDKGEVIFTSSNDLYEKQKCCIVPPYGFDRLDDILDEHKSHKTGGVEMMDVSDKLLSLLDEGLSHVEFVFKDEEMIIVQRDIYTGQRLEIREKSNDGLFSPTKNHRGKGLDKIGFRTKDIQSLFLLNPFVCFYFVSPNYTWVENKQEHFKGILSNCIYDQLGNLNILGDEKSPPSNKRARVSLT